MQSMINPYRGFYGRHLEVFDPFSLHFWDDFPNHHEFPFMRTPFMMPPPPPLPPLLSEMRQRSARTKIEYNETPDAHLFRAEIPGMKKEDVKVQVMDGNMLHISAKKKHEMEEKQENYHHVERGCGEFVSMFKLPPNVKPELIRTCVEDGVLTVTVPKLKVDKVEDRHY